MLSQTTWSFPTNSLLELIQHLTIAAGNYSLPSRGKVSLQRPKNGGHQFLRGLLHLEFSGDWRGRRLPCHQIAGAGLMTRLYIMWSRVNNETWLHHCTPEKIQSSAVREEIVGQLYERTHRGNFTSVQCKCRQLLWYVSLASAPPIWLQIWHRRSCCTDGKNALMSMEIMLKSKYWINLLLSRHPS